MTSADMCSSANVKYLWMEKQTDIHIAQMKKNGRMASISPNLICFSLSWVSIMPDDAAQERILDIWSYSLVEAFQDSLHPQILLLHSYVSASMPEGFFDVHPKGRGFILVVGELSLNKMHSGWGTFPSPNNAFRFQRSVGRCFKIQK